MVINQKNGLDQEIIIELPKLTESPKIAMSGKGKGHKEGMKSKEYGMSLILSNVPMSPKFINGSFAAMFETNDIIVEFAKQFGRNSVDFNGRPIRLSPRKRFKDKSRKQTSFDMSMLPAAKPVKRLAQVRQGSLDSKIEEIFDTSMESDDGIEENGTNLTVPGFSMAKLHKSLPCDDNGEVEEEYEVEDNEDEEEKEEEEEEEGEQGTGNNDEDNEQVVKTNGVHLVCKHCGSLVSVWT